MPTLDQTTGPYAQMIDLRDRTVKLLAELADPGKAPAHTPQNLKNLVEEYVENLHCIHSDCLAPGRKPPAQGSGEYFLFRAIQEALAWTWDIPNSRSMEKTQKDLARALSDIEWYIGQFPRKKVK